jgi:dihydrofolate synthase/folylpolyglutamate synthase
MHSYSDTVKYLYGLQRLGMKFGLRNIKALLASVDNPQRKFPSIHIAGTNGKGSTAAFLASVVMEAGYKTALYTSPHLLRFTERIRVNGREISERRLVQYAGQLRPMIESVRATFFEATTCIAFQYFADETVELAIVETGLGGRLDSTNVLVPLLSIITNVSFDHREYLGNTLRSIAREKAGIIKRDVPSVTGSREREVLETLKSAARKRGSRLFEASRVATLRVRENGKHRTTVSIRSPKVSIKDVPLGLDGLHQAENARLAVASVDILLRHRHFAFTRIRNASIARGLRRVKENTGIHGRLEKVGRHGRYTLDVAHNPAGVDTLVRALGNSRNRRYAIIFGVMKDKEYTPMIQGLAKVAEIFIAVAPSMPRALKVSVLYRRMKMLGVPAERSLTIRDGITKADDLAGPNGKVLITGSHFVVAEALGFLRRKRT